ncbi:MAG: hypothetical protein H6961_09340 [Chromatiaceae bacterium]|nr:hypothetical protein [Chromatiaceae bacterium]
MARVRRRDQASATHQLAHSSGDAAQGAGTGAFVINTSPRPKRAKRRARPERLPVVEV